MGETEFILINELRALEDLEYIDEYRLEMLEFYKKLCNLHERMIDIAGDLEHIKRLSLVSDEEKLRKREEKVERKREEREEQFRLQEGEYRTKKEREE